MLIFGQDILQEGQVIPLLPIRFEQHLAQMEWKQTFKVRISVVIFEHATHFNTS